MDTEPDIETNFTHAGDESQAATPPARSPRSGRPRKRDLKREAIIDAATGLLWRHGVAECTVRAIAEASNVSKSSLHYYFDDVEQIVDIAFERLMERFFERIDRAVAAAPTPLAALRDAAAAYLRLGVDDPTSERVPMLAFDFNVMSARRGDTEMMDQLVARFVAQLATLARNADLPQPEQTSTVLFWALIGAVVRGPFDHLDADDVVTTIGAVLHIPWTET